MTPYKNLMNELRHIHEKTLKNVKIELLSMEITKRSNDSHDYACGKLVYMLYVIRISETPREMIYKSFKRSNFQIIKLT